MRGYELTMSPYRFRIWADGIETHFVDVVAIDGPDQLWREAATSAGDMIRNMSERITPGLDWRLEVTDNAGTVIGLFSFKAELLS